MFYSFDAAASFAASILKRSIAARASGTIPLLEPLFVLAIIHFSFVFDFVFWGFADSIVSRKVNVMNTISAVFTSLCTIHVRAAENFFIGGVHRAFLLNKVSCREKRILYVPFETHIPYIGKIHLFLYRR